MSTPNQLRDAGMKRAEVHADPRVILAIDAAIERAIASGKPFSANDIRDEMPTTESKGLVGARVRAAATRRPVEMVRVGYVPSNLPSTHGHPIAQWLGLHPKPMKRDDLIAWLDLLPQEEHQRNIEQARERARARRSA